jgi:trigger factor
MQIEVIAQGTYQRTLNVTVPAGTVREQVDLAYRDLGKRARLKGFRPGKAPRTVLEARFGPQVLADVASDLIQRAYSDALAEHKLEPVSRPRVDRSDDIRMGEDFAFTIAVEIKPQVELEVWTGLDVEYPSAEVADEELNRAVESRVSGGRRLVAVERPVEKGDHVLAKLEVRDGETVVASEAGTIVQTQGDQYYRGLEDLLIGLSVGESRTGEVAFAANARTADVAGKTLTATVEVLGVQTYQIPELTDELAAELGYEGGVDGMKLALRASLQSGRDEMARNQARANLLQAIIEKNPFDVPSGMVDQQLEILVKELRLQQAYRGVDPRTVNFSEAQMADLRIRSEFAVKGGLILDFVARKEGVVVNEDDIERKLAELADERGQTIEAVRGYFEKEGATDELRERLLEEKCLDWLLEHANIVEKAKNEG